MSIEASLDIIGETLGPTVEEILADGLPNGNESQWKYDEELVNDIAKAIQSWVARLDELEEPWIVSHYDSSSNSWSSISKKVTHTEAYKIWYQKTKGGKENFNPSSDSYFYMGKANEILNGKHSLDAEEDDFSIRYLLNKSFGE